MMVRIVRGKKCILYVKDDSGVFTMKNITIVLPVFVLLCAFPGCEIDEVYKPNVIQSSVTTSELNAADDEAVTILGSEALMKLIAEKRRESPAFAAAMDGSFNGVPAGERSVVVTNTRPEPMDSAEDGTADDAEKYENPVEGVVPFSATHESGVGLRARIRNGVEPSDLEQSDGKANADTSYPPEPVPFRF